jgi:Uma2 family endonuclease
MTTAQRMTYEDLLAQPDDGYLHELVRGEIIRVPPPNQDHGTIEARLVGAICRYLHHRAQLLGWDEAQGIGARDLLVGRIDSGEAAIRFSLPDDPDQTRGGDVCYLTPVQVVRARESGPGTPIPLVPALIAEVVSPSDSATYVNEKVRDYLAGGAQSVWVVYPRTRMVQVHRADGTVAEVTGTERLDGGDVLPGFSLPLNGLFT